MKSKLTRLFFGSASIALLACQAAAEGKISGITTKTVGDGLEVQIKGEELSAPKINRAPGGRSFMLEFDATMTNDPQWIRVEQNGVHYVQSVYADTSHSKIRIHVRLDPDARVDYYPDASGYMIRINNAIGSKSKDESKTGPAKAELTSYTRPANLTAAPTTAPEVAPAVPVRTVAKGRLVSLDFVNTDVVEILKALALEAGVNIVAAPDVKGTLTVSLGTVSVKEALDLITTMDGLKYGVVGNTYLVTTVANFPHLMADATGKEATVSETRVVPIYSGEGIHIKDALKTTSNDVEILLPSEKALSAMQIAQAQQAINDAQLANYNKGLPGQPGSPNSMLGAGQGSNSSSANQKDVPKDTYLVLVGPSARVDTVEREVKNVDEQICRVEDIDYPLTNAMIREVYHPQGNSAVALLEAISPNTDKGLNGQPHSKIGTVELYATPEHSTSAQAIVLYGRESEVNRLVENLTSIDQLSETTGDYVVYNVKYLDPRGVREDLVVKFPGLSVNIPSAAAGDPAVYQQGEMEKQGTEKLGQQQSATSQNNNGNGSGGSSVSISGVDNGSAPGLAAPFAAEEAQAVPMKLVIRGSHDQIQNALDYLKAVDVAPKQVALELRVMELSREDALQLGLNWSILTGGKVQAIQMNNGSGVTPANNAAFPNSNPSSTPVGLTSTTGVQLQPLTGPGQVQGVLSGMPGVGTLGITAQLDQLANSNKMIARPNVLALDGRETEMFVGDDIKYIESIQSTQNGISVQTGDVEVGVRMAVLPRIGDGTITLDMRPMVSTLESWTPVPGGGQLPQTGLRIAQSTMVVHDGDTIAIGGLIQDTDQKQKSGIPILKDLPILGALFSQTNNDHQREEIVFFLTAKVVDPNTIQNAANPYSKPEAMPSQQHKHRH